MIGCRNEDDRVLALFLEAGLDSCEAELVSLEEGQVWSSRKQKRLRRAVRRFGGAAALERWIFRAAERAGAREDLAGSRARRIVQLKQQIVDSSVHVMALGIVNVYLIFQPAECRPVAVETYGPEVCWSFALIFFTAIFFSTICLLTFSYQCVYMFLGPPFATPVHPAAQYRLLNRADLRSVSLQLRGAIALMIIALPWGMAMKTRPIYAGVAFIILLGFVVHIYRWESQLRAASIWELVLEAKRQMEAKSYLNSRWDSTSSLSSEVL
jgi:hypothetical protein